MSRTVEGGAGTGGAGAGGTAGAHPHLMAVDVGGTGTKAALLDPAGRVHDQFWQPTGRESGPESVVRRVLDLVDGLCRRASEAGRPVSAVGLAVPGIVDEAAGTALRSTTIGWHDVPFGQLVRERTGLPVAVSHDVRAGGVAEARLGAGRAERDFLFVPVGTGIAAALIRDRRAAPGAHHRSGEIGHIAVRPDGERCACGGAGCAERYASAAAVSRRYGEAVGAPAGAASGAVADAAEVARRAAAGEPEARAVWDEAVSALADVLLVVCAVLDPPLIVVGGGLAQSGDQLLVPLRERMAERATVQSVPALVRAELGDRAGCLGAGLLAADLLSADPLSADPLSVGLPSARPGERESR
ncbi:ROK family protein [Streptomyces sp. NPDC060198]|uniref:ROK family protein n=1 Tax=Streptomyces sp. NPDC060198 TaxID=3347070 RepID=UPI00365F9F27